MDHCIKCKAQRKISKSYFLPGIMFNNLEGQPFICERCYFEYVTGLTNDWKGSLKIYLENLTK